MSDSRILDWIVIAAIVAIIFASFIGAVSTEKSFKEACNEIGGKTVWDGRQYQCMKS